MHLYMQQCSKTSMMAARKKKTAIAFDSWKWKHYFEFIKESKNIVFRFTSYRKQDVLNFKNIYIEPHECWKQCKSAVLCNNSRDVKKKMFLAEGEGAKVVDSDVIYVKRYLTRHYMFLLPDESYLVKTI